MSSTAAQRDYGVSTVDFAAVRTENPRLFESFDPARYDGSESFRNLVARDVKNESSEDERAFLRDPGTTQRWHDALVALNKHLETQFSERRAAAELKHRACLARGPEGKDEWFAFRAQHNAWRAGANKFKSKVEASLAECKRLMREARSERAASRKAPEELDAYRNALREVRDFLSEEAAVAPEKECTRRELLGLVDGVLLDPAGRRGPSE